METLRTNPPSASPCDAGLIASAPRPAGGHVLKTIFVPSDNSFPFSRILTGKRFGHGGNASCKQKEKNMSSIKPIGLVSSAHNITPGGLRRLPELNLHKYSPDTAVRRLVG